MDAIEWAARKARGYNERRMCASTEDYLAASERYLPDLRESLDDVVMASDAEAGLDALLDCGALSALLPEVHEMVGFSDGEWRHKDVWKHTKQVVCQSPQKLELRWSALLHDIGKTKTRSISPNGEVHFFGHAEVGASMFDRMERRIPILTGSLGGEVRFLILNHLRAGQYDRSWTDSAVRRFAKEMGGSLDNLVCLTRADITTKRPEKKRRIFGELDDLVRRINTLAAEDAKTPPLPKDIGNAIMEAFNLQPSKKIGDMKRLLELAVNNGEIQPYLDCGSYLDFIRDNADQFGV